MYVATLIAKPGILMPALVEALRNAWGGESVQYLAADEAAEFAMATMPKNIEDVWSNLQDQSVDLIVQPLDGRRKKMLLADMDSTMIEQECIDELAHEAGVGAEVASITAKAMNGDLDFEGALDARVGLLNGLDATIIDQVLKTRITFMPGGRHLVQTMKANGGYTALVSGGFTAFTAQVAVQLGFDENRANILDIKNGILTGRVERPILGQQAKFDALTEITSRLGFAHSDVIAVGDGMNDLLMLQHAGTGVALHGKPALQQRCKIRVNHADLTALLFIQGYARHEFVE